MVMFAKTMMAGGGQDSSAGSDKIVVSNCILYVVYCINLGSIVALAAYFHQPVPNNMLVEMTIFSTSRPNATFVTNCTDPRAAHQKG
jgi:hypothetical protein